MTTQQQYLEILFPKNLDTEDLTITRQPSRNEPGQATIKRAEITGAEVKSWTGAKFGILYGSDDLIGPFYETFEVK